MRCRFYLVQKVKGSKNSLEWEHSETLVHARRVTEESSESSLENETKVESPIPHTLVNDRVPSSLTDDQIGPLYDDDRYEESRVTGEFQCFTISVGLFRHTKIDFFSTDTVHTGFIEVFIIIN